MRFFIFIPILLLSLAVFSQSDLEEKYQLLKENAETYNEFKVFRETRLDEFWTQTMDEFNGLKSELSKTQTEVGRLSTELAEARGKIKELEAIISEKEIAATTISVLGMQFSKGSFITLSFALISILAVVLILGYLKFQSYRQMVGRTMQENEELHVEYEEFRHRSVERERRIARELQDEKNKMEEILTKG